METTILGGGCFWCLDAVFRQIRGVKQVLCGYAGGRDSAPSYARVCSGQSDHAEVVQIRFDPQETTFSSLLEVFFAIHDPTTRDRQGHDLGPQYRSLILARDAGQAEQAHALIARLDAEHVYPQPVLTQVQLGQEFFPAEAEHQDYYQRHPQQGYCQVVIAPKLAELRRQLGPRLQPPI